MAEVTIVRRGGRMFPPSMVVILGGVEVTFTRAWIEGERVMVATLDTEAPGTEEILRKCAMMSDVYRIPNRAPKVVAIDSAKPAPAGPPPAPMTPRDIALRNGWLVEDLAGAGLADQWGPEGGLSTVSGLTMAEMALCSPPKAWRRPEQWPWEVGAWRGPAPEWRPPLVPSKVRAVEPEAPAAAEPVDSPEPKLPPMADDAAAPVDDPDAQIEVVEALEGYGTEEEVTMATMVLEELVRSGGVPTRQKAGYHLRKHGLPSPTDEQFQALLNTLT